MIGKILFFWLPFLMLLSISLLLMFHARFITNTYAHHFEKQLLWFSIGFLLFFLIKWIPIKKIFSLSIPLSLLNLLFLILVLIVGTNVNGAKAWIDFHYFSFQPSELMKFSLALFLADFCSHKKCQNYKEELILLLEVFILTIIPSILVFLEPDTGSILFYFCIALTILWNKVHKRWFVIIGFLIYRITLNIPLILFILFSKRFVNFTHWNKYFLPSRSSIKSRKWNANRKCFNCFRKCPIHKMESYGNRNLYPRSSY